jgi:sarcosine oxidase
MIHLAIKNQLTDLHTMNTYDFIVVGLGTVGSATCMELARRGHSVLGLDTLHPPHNQGSHHGESRSIRRAYLEGTSYVSMALHSWESWQRLERDTKTTLLIPTENLTIGPPDCPAVLGFLASAQTYDIPYQDLTAADIAKRWPQLSPPRNFVAGLEIEAGLLFPELCIASLISEAKKAGATLKFDGEVHGWSDNGNFVQVQADGGMYEAGRLLLAAGARTKKLLGHLGTQLFPKRVPVHWISPPDWRKFELGAFPVNFWQLPTFEINGTSNYTEFYSLPITRSDGRVKVATHNRLDDCDPDKLDRKVSTKEVKYIREFIKNYIPTLANCDAFSDVCMYTLTPDGEFSLGPLPGHENVLIAALAGHGFKFAPVLGQILADMLEGISPAYDVTIFSPDRFI